MNLKINKPVTKTDLKEKIWGFDIETCNTENFRQATNPNHDSTSVCTISLCNSKTVYGFNINHPSDTHKKLTTKHRLDEIWKVLGDSNNTIVGHSVVEFDTVFCELHFHREIKASFFDTLVAYSLCNENSESNTLDNVSYELLGERKIEIDSRHLDQYSPKDVLEYNMRDAWLSYRLKEVLEKRLEAEGQEGIFFLCMEVITILKRMMVLGTNQDSKWLEVGLDTTQSSFDELETKLLDMLTDDWKDINFNSPIQLSKLLFETMGLPIIERSPKTGNPSTGKDILIQLGAEKIIDEDGKLRETSKEVKRFVGTLNEYRKQKKLLTTYLFPLLEKHPHKNRIHTRFHMGKKQFGKYDVSGTRTGRLSSSNPNLQNQPRADIIRGSFIPSNGYSMFSVDYKQLELRIAAWYSQDEAMLSAIEDGLDIHTYTLSGIMGIPYPECVERLENGDKKLKEHRVVAKNTNFLILYGGGPYRLAKTARVAGVYLSLSESKRIINNWKGTYPQLARTLKDWRKIVLKYGEIQTPIGRKRRFPRISWGKQEQALAVRQGINFRIQSFASDITLIGMYLLEKEFQGNYSLKCTRKSNVRLLMQVHDEVIGEYRNVDGITEIIEACMVTGVNRFLSEICGITIPVPLEIDVETEMKRWNT